MHSNLDISNVCFNPSKVLRTLCDKMAFNEQVVFKETCQISDADRRRIHCLQPKDSVLACVSAKSGN